MGGKPSIATKVRRGPLAGMVIELDPRVEADSILGAYESRIQEAMCSELRDGDKVFDVGAHFGYVALVIATCLGSSGEVVCFEPDPLAYRTLCSNVELNGASIEARITKVRAAVGASAGRATFSRGVHSTRGKLSEAGDVEVDVVTLDDARQRFGVPRLVKVDVEGGELEVLKGGAELLRTRATIFVVETHSASLNDACKQVFESYGYESEQLHERGRAETHLVARPPGTS